MSEILNIITDCINHHKVIEYTNPNDNDILYIRGVIINANIENDLVQMDINPNCGIMFSSPEDALASTKHVVFNINKFSEFIKILE